MIRHNFKRKDFSVKLTSLIINNLFKAIFNLINKNFFTPLGTPYQVVVQKIYVMFVSFVFHVDSIQYINTKYKLFFKEK